MKYKHIFWDWNGTLADDSEAAYKSVNDLLAKRGMAPITMEQYYSYVDTPIIRFYERIFDLNSVDYEEILKDFQEGYVLHLPETGLMADAVSVLENFRNRGFNQMIISSCEQNQLLSYTALFGISSFFDAILGASDFLAESKIERAKQYMHEQNIAPDSILMIGDTLHDYETARALGADCILIASGHQSEDTLRSSGVPVIHFLRELTDMMEGL
jgi:phosphoglycolate phosphatase